MVSPPQASGTRPCSESCCRTRFGSASSRSILLMATMIGHVGGLGVVDGLDGLGHDAVVGGHHQDHDVRHLGATGAHRGEGLVARRVDERDRLALPLDLVGADVLGDPTGLAGDHVGMADLVQQQGLAVVDVAHDGDDRRTGPQVLLVLLLVVVVEELGQQFGLALLAGVDEADLGAEFGGEQLDHVVGQRLGGGHHLPLQEQEADDVTGRAVELGTEIVGRRAALDDDLVLGDGSRGRRVRGQRGRLELLEVPTPTARTALVGTAAADTGPTATTGSAGTAAGTAAGAAAVAAARATGAAAVAATRGARRATGAWRAGSTGTGTRAGTAGESAGPRAAGRRAAATGPGGRRDGLPGDRTRRAARGRRDGPARRAGRRADRANRVPTGWRRPALQLPVPVPEPRVR